MFIQIGPLQYGGSCSVLRLMYIELQNSRENVLKKKRPVAASNTKNLLFIHLVLESDRSPKLVHRVLVFEMMSSCFPRICDFCISINICQSSMKHGIQT